jgi:hypothetical protein
MRELGDRLASPRITAYALMADGWLQMHDGNADGVDAFREGWKILTSYSHHTYSPYSAQQAAVALLRLGQIDAARATLNEGFALLDRTEARWCEAELHRSQGEIAAAVAATQRPRSKARLQATTEAEDCFHRAIDVASAQGARWWELRARFSLARQLAVDQRVEAAVDDGSDIAELHAIRAFLKQTTDEHG